MSDTCARFADIGEKVLRGEVSPGVAAGAERAAYSLPADRRAQRKFFDAFSSFRSQVQDCAALSGPAGAQLMQRFLAVVGEQCPTQAQFDDAMKRGRQ